MDMPIPPDWFPERPQEERERAWENFQAYASLVLEIFKRKVSEEMKNTNGPCE